MTKVIRNVPKRLALHMEHDDYDSLVEMSTEIRLLEARMWQLLDTMEETQVPDRWAELKKLWDRFTAAQEKAAQTDRAGDYLKVQNALSALGKFIMDSYLYEYILWTELHSVIEQLRKVKETETKRRAAAARTVTERDVQLLLANILQTIGTYVSDEKERRIVLERIGSYTANL